DGASTTTAPGTSTTLPGSTTTSTTPTPPPGEVVATWPVFFVQEPEGSFTQNPAIVPFDVRVYDTEDVPQNITDSPEDLLFNLDLLSFEIPEGFVNAVPAGVEIVGKSFETTDEGVTR